MSPEDADENQQYGYTHGPAPRLAYEANKQTSPKLRALKFRILTILRDPKDLSEALSSLKTIPRHL